MTKRELLNLLEPYGDDEPVVFVSFDAGMTVYENVEVAKSHSTKYVAPDGVVTMPIAVYLVGEGSPGRAHIMGLPDEEPGGGQR